MKKSVILTGFALLVVVGASAQVKAYKADQVDNPTSVAYALPQTKVVVRLTVVKERVKVGPYARFAQKYLGVMAPLADKTVYSIAGATMASEAEADPAEVYVVDNPSKAPGQIYQPTAEGMVALMPQLSDGVPPMGPCAKSACGIEQVSYVASDTSFLAVTVDRNSVTEKSPETMAADAANMIFSLRKHRIDLITGEAGENVFGGGLDAALRELNRMEQEYTALFLGKRYREISMKEVSVVPTKGEPTAIVCRFSEGAGVVASSDLAGRPITLEMTPEKRAEKSPLMNRKSKETKGTIYYRIADMVGCRLTDGARELADARMPMYQWGEVVQMPITPVK